MHTIKLIRYFVSSHHVHADDIAVDWVGNNLYWTDAFYARIEVMDLDTRHRRELLRTGNNTIPRAIAVDPSTRYYTQSYIPPLLSEAFNNYIGICIGLTGEVWLR